MPLADGLNSAESHKLKLYFRAASLQERWHTSVPNLRIGGISLDDGGNLSLSTVRPKKAVIFGDSVTEVFSDN